MKVERYSKEIIKIGENYVALSGIHSIGPVRLYGSRGHGDVWYSFEVKSIFGEKGITSISGEGIEYYKLDRDELGWNEEEHPMYVDAKVEVLTIRDEVVQLWSEYLEGKV
ncbi:hypothetical protein D3C80_435310 [compost metagenome]